MPDHVHTSAPDRTPTGTATAVANSSSSGTVASPPAHPVGRLLWALIRLATAAALAIAITAQVVNTARYSAENGLDVGMMIANHFSYFTVLSTSAGTLVLAIGGIWLATRGRRGGNEPVWLSILFLSIGSAMVITGIVYNVLLRNDGAPDPDTLTWASEIKHVIAPIVFALDLILHIGRSSLRWSAVALTLIYPLAWAVYTLLRGELVTDPLNGTAWWYPYGFLDPHTSATGYAGVAVYVVAIAAALALIAAGSIWLSRRASRIRGAGATPGDTPR